MKQEILLGDSLKLDETFKCNKVIFLEINSEALTTKKHYFMTLDIARALTHLVAFKTSE